MIRSLEKSLSFKALQKALALGESVLFESLWNVPKALLAAFVAEKTGRNLLVLTGGVREDAFFDSLETLAPGLGIEFPAWETLPGEEIQPSPDIIGKRMEALQNLLCRKKPAIVLCSLQALLQKIPSKEGMRPLFTTWKKGTKAPFGSLPERLQKLGYKRADVVSDKGEFAIRGSILDLYPPSSPDPFRIGFWGDEIEEIRTFDSIGQKSIGEAEEIPLMPANEMALLQSSQKLVSIADYLGENFLVFWDDMIAIEDNWTALKSMPGSQSPFFFSFDEIHKRLKSEQHLFGTPQPIEQISEVKYSRERSQHLQSVTFESLHKTFEAQRWFHPFCTPRACLCEPETEDAELIDLIPPKPDIPITFLNANETEEQEVRRQLSRRGVDLSSVQFERGYLASGFCVRDIPFLVIPNAELTGRTRIRRQKWRGTTHTPSVEFHQLSPGDPVVHFHSGIGKYLGMEKQINHLGEKTEFMVIQYLQESKLFVPLNQAYLVSRYIGTAEEPPSLSQLGSKRWQNTRIAAQQQIVGYANDLLRLYAERAVQGKTAYPPDSDLMRQFEADFPYTETSDQLDAILAIKNDMMAGKSMDRLVCGDVGYGKTEVAMRAAFKAVADGNKQVVVLVPTTVLALQHFETFSQRMSGFPISISAVSRFHTAKENRETLQKTSRGEIDILVGTHRLLSKDVQFKDLGLLIIDEEQRFGVRAKEHLKKFKAGVDTLTLSATPIPRTLYMSLVHARDMSVISTPPQDRLPVKSILAETDLDLIQNALLREFSRGGQAFFIHNRVETIFQRADAISKLVPSARIGVVHGQMSANEIDLVFHRFKEGSLDLLFATTIVENGIDIPNANTILIERADTYGMADLYQLRGRVGRWNRSAYAYFLIPKNKRLPEIARKRLNALVEASGYGGGMKIAMRDLEIRGAGDILGTQQSGQVSAIGFHLYCKLLKRTIDALKKQAPITFNETKIEAPFDARIPESYLREVSLRMEFYYRFGDASTTGEIDDLLAELKDRFGEPPEQTLWLYHLARLRVFVSAHQYTLLKFQNLTVFAERQKGKKTEQRTIVLPKKVQSSPKELESYLIEKLSPYPDYTETT